MKPTRTDYATQWFYLSEEGQVEWLDGMAERGYVLSHVNLGHDSNGTPLVHYVMERTGVMDTSGTAFTRAAITEETP